MRWRPRRHQSTQPSRAAPHHSWHPSGLRARHEAVQALWLDWRPCSPRCAMQLSALLFLAMYAWPAPPLMLHVRCLQVLTGSFCVSGTTDSGMDLASMHDELITSAMQSQVCLGQPPYLHSIAPRAAPSSAMWWSLQATCGAPTPPFLWAWDRPQPALTARLQLQLAV